MLLARYRQRYAMTTLYKTQKFWGCADGVGIADDSGVLPMACANILHKLNFQLTGLHVVNER